MLCQDHDTDHALLSQITEQLMHLQCQKATVRHGVQVAVEAVQQHHSGALYLDAMAYRSCELARRKLGWVDLAKVQQSFFQPGFDIQSQCPTACQQRTDAFIKDEKGDLFAAFASRYGVAEHQRRLAHPGCSNQQCAGATLKPAAKQPVQPLVAAGDQLTGKCGVMLSGNQTWVNRQSAFSDTEIVIAPAELDAAHLDHPQAPSLGAIVDGQLLKHHYAVANGVQLKVTTFRGLVVDQDDGTVPGSEKVLERQHLPPIAQRALGQ